MNLEETDHLSFLSKQISEKRLKTFQKNGTKTEVFRSIGIKEKTKRMEVQNER